MFCRFGNVLPKRTARNIGKIGPQTLALLDNASREQLSLDMTVEIAGYEGEWFDPDDVQGYLEEKGIFIDPAATFAEADVVVDTPLLPSAGSMSSAASSARTPAAFADTTALDSSAAAEWSELFDDVGLTNVGFSDAETGSFMNFLQPGQTIKRTGGDAMRWTDDWMDGEDAMQDITMVSLTTTPRTKKVIIDVRKLVKGKSGLCVEIWTGNSPADGFGSAFGLGGVFGSGAGVQEERC